MVESLAGWGGVGRLSAHLAAERWRARRLMVLPKHPIVAHDGGDTRLRRLDAALFVAALEEPKRLQLGNGGDGHLGIDGNEMHERAVIKPQHQIADAVRRFGL